MSALIALTGYAPTLLPARIGTQTEERSLTHHQPLIGRMKLYCGDGLGAYRVRSTMGMEGPLLFGYSRRR